MPGEIDDIVHGVAGVILARMAKSAMDHDDLLLDDDPAPSLPPLLVEREQISAGRAPSATRADRGSGFQMIAARGAAYFWIDTRKQIENEESATRELIPNPTFGWYLCRSPYSKEMVDELKLVIPHKIDDQQQRMFLKPMKVWAVHPRSSEKLVNIVSKYFEVRELTQDPWARSSEQSTMGRAVLDRLRSNREDIVEASKAADVEMPEFAPRKVEV